MLSSEPDFQMHVKIWGVHPQKLGSSAYFVTVLDLDETMPDDEI